MFLTLPMTNEDESVPEEFIDALYAVLKYVSTKKIPMMNSNEL